MMHGGGPTPGCSDGPPFADGAQSRERYAEEEATNRRMTDIFDAASIVLKPTNWPGVSGLWSG